MRGPSFAIYMFVFLEISQIRVKKLLCHSVPKIYFLPKFATDSCLMYFSIVTVLIQHVDIWVETQFPFPVFSFLCKDIVESSNFMGGCFWSYCQAASLVLFLSRVCLHTSLLQWESVAWLLPACLTHCLLRQIMEASKFPTSSWQVMSTEMLQT